MRNVGKNELINRRKTREKGKLRKDSEFVFIVIRR